MMEYREQMDMDNPNAVKYILEHIEKIVDKKIKNLQFDRKYQAKVVSVVNGKANIQLLGSSNTITGVKIRDGLTLVANDEVYITAINGSLNNIFVDIKK